MSHPTFWREIASIFRVEESVKLHPLHKTGRKLGSEAVCTFQTSDDVRDDVWPGLHCVIARMIEHFKFLFINVTV
jgi:hypothetical protein